MRTTAEIAALCREYAEAERDNYKLDVPTSYVLDEAAAEFERLLPLLEKLAWAAPAPH